MEKQAAISAEKLKQNIGRNRDVIIDAIDTQENMIIARTSSDAPDIDGLVYIEMTDEHPVNVGDITQVTITDTDEYDMWAKFSD
jgi:ribosomal protein S12 methylthiotransferase